MPEYVFYATSVPIHEQEGSTSGKKSDAKIAHARLVTVLVGRSEHRFNPKIEVRSSKKLHFYPAKNKKNKKAKKKLDQKEAKKRKRNPA